MERVGGGRESESESVACWGENHIKNRWYSAAFKKFIAHEFGNCAYVEASPSFGSVSNDTATVTTGAAASHLMHHQGI